jgi:ATP-dependent Clp protease adaptor protein ClpS
MGQSYLKTGQYFFNKIYRLNNLLLLLAINLKWNKMQKEKSSPYQNTETVKEDLKELILYNDDVNTFDFVIDTLVEVCQHDPLQAEQCAMVVHFNGKCAVKTGSLNELKPRKDEMSNRKLIVSIN